MTTRHKWRGAYQSSRAPYGAGRAKKLKPVSKTGLRKKTVITIGSVRFLNTLLTMFQPLIGDRSGHVILVHRVRILPKVRRAGRSEFVAQDCSGLLYDAYWREPEAVS